MAAVVGGERLDDLDKRLLFAQRRLNGHNQLPKLILGVKFTNGLEAVAKQVNRKPEATAA